MSDEEFNERLNDLDVREEGYRSRYNALVKELMQMPSLMALAKQAESKDVSDAVKDSPKADSEDKADAAEAAKKQDAGKGESSDSGSADKSADEGKKGGETSDAEEPAAKTETPAKSEEKAAEEPAKSEEKTAETPTKSSDGEEKSDEATDKTDAGDKKEGDAASKEGEGGAESKEKEGEGEDKSGDGEKKEEKKKEEKTTLQKLAGMKDEALELGKSGISLIGAGSKLHGLRKIKTEDNGSSHTRNVNYAKGEANTDVSNKAFGAANSILNVVNKAVESFAGEEAGKLVSKITGIIGKGLAFGKDFFARRFSKKSAKAGLKGLLGGTAAYKALKEKYKMHAPEMRRAIRTAAKKSSVQELVNADKDMLKKGETNDGGAGAGKSDGEDESAPKKIAEKTKKEAEGDDAA